MVLYQVALCCFAPTGSANVFLTATFAFIIRCFLSCTAIKRLLTLACMLKPERHSHSITTMEFVERVKLPSFHTPTVFEHISTTLWSVYYRSRRFGGHLWVQRFKNQNKYISFCMQKTIIYACMSPSIAHFHRTQHEQSAFACNSRLRSPSLFLYVLLKP